MEGRIFVWRAVYALFWGAALFLLSPLPALHAAEFQTQFRLPPSTGDGKSPALSLPKRLTYQYGYSSESDITYRANRDLDRRVSDDALILAPEWQGGITYRPIDQLELTLSLILAREFPVIEQPRIRLPDGQIVFSKRRKTLLEADEAAITIQGRKDPLELTIGRKRVEDNRHWLYDTSMDTVSISRVGVFQVNLHGGRERIMDLETSRDIPDRIDTGILYVGYRGIANMHTAGYTVFRKDRNKKNGEGEPQLMGVRSSGIPSVNFKYWAELAHLGGRDELSRPFEGYALDIGSIYRAEGILATPHVILGFAFATGDDPKDKKNNEFRQTGLQSNETRFGGIPEMKIYGEVLNPELSNLRVITAGLSFRPGQNFSIDLIYHRYRLNQLEEIRDYQLTAVLNPDDLQRTRDVGSAFDVGMGIRRLFGFNRLGVDIRAGLFFPGPAFRNIENVNVRSAFRFRDRLIPANKGISVLAKFWL